MVAESGEPKMPSPERLCPRCFKPVDPLTPDAHRNPTTRKWEHKDCRVSPRPSGGRRVLT